MQLPFWMLFLLRLPGPGITMQRFAAETAAFAHAQPNVSEVETDDPIPEGWETALDPVGRRY